MCYPDFYNQAAGPFTISRTVLCRNFEITTENNQISIYINFFLLKVVFSIASLMPTLIRNLGGFTFF